MTLISVPNDRRPKTSRGHRRLSPSREAIVEASRRLYAVSDYTGVTMRAVAQEVGCQSPSLYHYFKSKDDIFRALVDDGTRLFEQFMPAAESANPMTQLWWRFWRYYEFSKAHPEYFRLLFVERSSPVGDETLHERVLSGADTRACIEVCMKAGLLPADTDPIRTAVVLVCAIHGAAMIGMRDAVTPLHRDALAVSTLRLAFDGVRAGLLQNQERGVSGMDEASAYHAELASASRRS
jgi:AcrR family transcriptional regulator